MTVYPLGANIYALKPPTRDRWMMKNLKLEKPIAFIDVETTGTHPHSDRIVELSVFRVQPDGGEDYRSHREYRFQPKPPPYTG